MFTALVSTPFTRLKHFYFFCADKKLLAIRRVDAYPIPKRAYHILHDLQVAAQVAAGIVVAVAPEGCSSMLSAIRLGVCKCAFVSVFNYRESKLVTTLYYKFFALSTIDLGEFRNGI